MPKRRKKDRRNWALKDVPRHTWNVKTQTCYERTWVVSQHWNNCQWTKSHGLFRTLKLNPSLYGDSITLYFKLSKITVWHLSSFCCLLHPIGSGEFIWIIIKKKELFSAATVSMNWIKKKTILFIFTKWSTRSCRHWEHCKRDLFAPEQRRDSWERPSRGERQACNSGKEGRWICHQWEAWRGYPPKKTCAPRRLPRRLMTPFLQCSPKAPGDRTAGMHSWPGASEPPDLTTSTSSSSTPWGATLPSTIIAHGHSGQDRKG